MASVWTDATLMDQNVGQLVRRANAGSEPF